MAIEAANWEKAKGLFYDKCNPIGLVPDVATLKEITRKEYEKIITTLMGISK